MNKFFEPLRGSWITREREKAEDNRNYIRGAAENIPTEVRERMLLIVDRAESTEQFCDSLIQVTGKDASRQTQKIMFLESQIKGLIQAIRSGKDAESLRAVARETVERLRERAYREEQERLHASSSTSASLPSPSVVP